MVDRPGVEEPWGLELTGTNRSRALLISSVTNLILSMGRNIQNIKQNVQQIYILLCGFQSTNSDRFSGDSYEDPPVPISNTVVKLINAESTWLETAWEDREPLIDVKAHLRVCLFLCMASYPPRVPGEQGSRRWRSEATTDSLHRLVWSVRWPCSYAT